MLGLPPGPTSQSLARRKDKTSLVSVFSDQRAIQKPQTANGDEKVDFYGMFIISSDDIPS